MRPAAGAVRDAAPRRFVFLDGLRGLAALYVVLHHAALLVPPAALPGPAAFARFVLRHGHYAVPVFITLSGYSLMLGVRATPGGRLSGGLTGYLGRRARRILPPYYAALAFCWLLTAVSPSLGRPSATAWDRALPSFGPGVVVSHLVLVHNLDPAWIYRVAPPFWSLATEWQIYLVFPALLALRRRLGMMTAVGVGFAVGSAVSLLSVPSGNLALRELCPWYLGLFALGMAGAEASGPAPPSAPWRARAARRGWAAASAVLAVGLACVSAAWAGGGYLMFTDALTGALTTCLVVRCARVSSHGGTTPVLSLLESRAAVRLGSSSYSLYLTHYPLLALSHVWLRDLGLSPGARLAVLLTAVTPACLLAAALFARVFERVPSPRRTLGAKPHAVSRLKTRSIPRNGIPSGLRNSRSTREIGGPPGAR